MDRTAKNKKWISFLRPVILIICGAVIGINVYAFNARNLVGNHMPMPFGYGMAVVLSGSMEPVLSVYDLILVQEEDDYEIDDIVVYQDMNGLVVHRIIDRSDDKVQTKGDANTVADAWIAVSDIKGKMIGSLPGVGILIQALKKPVGILILLTASFLLLEFSYRRERDADVEEIEKIKEEIRRLREEQED